jgi:ribosomal protein S7
MPMTAITAATAASPTHIVSLSDVARRKALRAIEDVHAAYYDKGGIRDTAKQLEGQVNSTARVVYSLAVYASSQCETLDEAAELFRSMCAFAEAEYKQQHDVDNLREALPTWATYKSNVLRGVTQYQLDPVDYRSERQFRIAVDTKRGTARQQREQPELKDPEAIDSFLEMTAIRSSLRPHVTALVHLAEVVSRGKTHDAAEVLKEATDRLTPLIDQEKLDKLN